jgi:hypothetical protein
MALNVSRATFVIAAVVVLGAALWYLRDPPWLDSYSSGFHPWETATDGRPYRWTKGHASFFVPSDARRITLPLRSLKETPQDWPVTVTVTIDDRIADRVTFRDEEWHELSVRLPDPATRHVRRVDLTVDRVRSRLRGIQAGTVEVLR